MVIPFLQRATCFGGAQALYLHWANIQTPGRPRRFLHELIGPYIGLPGFRRNDAWFQIVSPRISLVYFQTRYGRFQSTLRSIYGVSGTMCGFSPSVRVVIASDLNGLFLVQWPLPPSYFQSIMHVSRLFLVQTRFYFQSDRVYFQSSRHLFLVQNQVLDPVSFGLLAIQRKHLCTYGWIFAYNFILYKSK